MKVRRNQTVEQATLEALAESRTLAILVARVKLFASTTKEKRLAKQYATLVASLERLSRIQIFSDLTTNQNSQNEQSPFIDGIPRWVLQVPLQFKHYVNPPSEYQSEWSEKRLALWSAFEQSIPDSVRDVLLSWRWRAELAAFKQMLVDLDESQQKVKTIAAKIEKEERKAARNPNQMGLFDRLKILRWSNSAKIHEREIELLEAEKQRKTAEMNELLAECERLAASIAIEMKTTLVDCGTYCSTVFEECTRAVDGEIKKDLDTRGEEIESENEFMRRTVEHWEKNRDTAAKKMIRSREMFNRAVDGEWERKMSEAQELIRSEFLFLNAFEMEQQEDARIRWNSAVRTMKKILRNAEENLIHGRSFD